MRRSTPSPWQQRFAATTTTRAATVLAAIAVAQFVWLVALVYGVIWLLT